MMDQQIINKPVCENCHKESNFHCYVHSTLLCGNCLIKWQQKNNLKMKKVILEDLK